MLKRLSIIVVAVAVAGSIPFMAGCETDAQSGALIGAGAGAGIGALAGGDGKSTLIGAAIGTGAGYLIGNESDKKKTREEIAAVRDEQNFETVWITTSNGSQVAVKLRRSGPGDIVPKGEYYPTRPTEDQLNSLYGF